MKAGDRNVYDYFQQFGKWRICLDDDSDDEDVSPSSGVRFPARDLVDVTRQSIKLAIPLTSEHESFKSLDSFVCDLFHCILVLQRLVH